jgi:hypothetical protein
MFKPADFLARSRVGTARSRVKGAPWTQKPRDSAGPSRVSRMSKYFDDPYMRESDPRDPHDESVLLSRKVKNHLDHLDTLDGAKDSAAFDIALSRDDLGPPPVSVTRARVRTAGRREIRRGKAAMVNDAQAFLDQVSSEAAAERYAGQARRWYGIADPQPRNTIK